jgi:hypothetical protein
LVCSTWFTKQNEDHVLISLNTQIDEVRYEQYAKQVRKKEQERGRGISYDRTLDMRETPAVRLAVLQIDGEQSW